MIEQLALLLTATIAGSSHNAKYHHIDNMQVSIESRIGLEARACSQPGVVGEVVELDL